MLFVYSHILYLLALAVSNRDGADEAGVLMLNLQRCLFDLGHVTCSAGSQLLKMCRHEKHWNVAGSHEIERLAPSMGVPLVNTSKCRRAACSVK